MVTPRDALNDLLHSRHTHLYLHCGEATQFTHGSLDQLSLVILLFFSYPDDPRYQEFKMAKEKSSSSMGYFFPPDISLSPLKWRLHIIGAQNHLVSRWWVTKSDSELCHLHSSSWLLDPWVLDRKETMSCIACWLTLYATFKRTLSRPSSYCHLVGTTIASFKSYFTALLTQLLWDGGTWEAQGIPWAWTHYILLWLWIYGQKLCCV